MSWWKVRSTNRLSVRLPSTPLVFVFKQKEKKDIWKCDYIHAWEEQMCVSHLNGWTDAEEYLLVWSIDVQLARGQTSTLCANLSQPTGGRFTLTVCIRLPPVISGSCGFPHISRNSSAHQLTRAWLIILDTKAMTVYQNILPFPIIIYFSGPLISI